jgi:ferrochelatase
MYPHYAKATFKSVIDKTKNIVDKLKKDINLKIIPPFYDHPAYLGAIVATAERYLSWDFDHILFSYHGIPEKHIKNTDPTGDHCLVAKKCCITPSPAHNTCYRHQALITTSAIAKMLKIPREKYSVAFKNKFSSNGWLQPYTLEEISRLANDGIKKLLVICPSFVADCRETLQEIGIRGKTIFLENGGEELRMIRCLNENPAWIDALNEFCTKTTVNFYSD